MAHTPGLYAPRHAQQAQRRQGHPRPRMALGTQITVIGFLFLAALVGMSMAVAALSVWGPGGEAGQALAGLAVAVGLGLMLGCAVWLLCAIASFPQGSPNGRPGRGCQTAGRRRPPEKLTTKRSRFS